MAIFHGLEGAIPWAGGNEGAHSKFLAGEKGFRVVWASTPAERMYLTADWREKLLVYAAVGIDMCCNEKHDGEGLLEYQSQLET